MQTLLKKHSGLAYFLGALIACNLIVWFLVWMDSIFPAQWVVLGSLAAMAVGTYAIKYWNLWLGKLQPQTISGYSEINGVRIYKMKSSRPNAYAFGFGGARAIIFTTSFLEKCSEKELTAVLIHEDAHMHYGDFLIGNGVLLLIGNSIALVVSGLGWEPLWLVVTTLIMSVAGLLAYLAYSRAKERRADVYAAARLKDPADLARALLKIDDHLRSLGYVRPSVETFWTRYFLTHPLTTTRAKKLGVGV